MAEFYEQPFSDLVDRKRGEVVIAIGQGTFVYDFHRAMDHAREYGHQKATATMRDRILSEIDKGIGIPHLKRIMESLKI